MSDEIKVGDLVVVVRKAPCCGNDKYTGYFYTVAAKGGHYFVKCSCGQVDDNDDTFVMLNDGNYIEKNRLKKIDPPAKGDTLPTRADLDMPVKEVV